MLDTEAITRNLLSNAMMRTVYNTRAFPATNDTYEGVSCH